MPASDLLALLSGLIVGVSLGLTGGGGSIFAVPLLVYVLGLPAPLAVGLSLAIVGLTAGFGAVLRLGKREIDWLAGVAFAAAGMVAAPGGAWLGRRVPAAVLLSAFAGLMLIVGLRMWRGGAAQATTPGPCAFRPGGRRGWGCYGRLALAGLAAGVLSGFFGVGGGFIIVPALLHVTGMRLHHAIATSLVVILLISLSGVVASLSHGTDWPWELAGFFLVGGLAGMAGGSTLRSRLPARQLQLVFAVGVWLVAALMLARNVPTLIES